MYKVVQGLELLNAFQSSIMLVLTVGWLGDQWPVMFFVIF